MPLVAVGVLSIAGLAYSAASPGSQLVNQERVYGGGEIGPGCLAPDVGICIDDTRNFAIDAHAAAAGKGAFGDSSYGGPTHDQHERVTCLAVDGGRAAIGTIVTQADRPSVVGWWALMFVTDRGTPASGQPDLASLQYFGPPDPASWPSGFPYACPSPDTGAPAFGLLPSYLPLDGGELVVQDANP